MTHLCASGKVFFFVLLKYLQAAVDMKTNWVLLTVAGNTLTGYQQGWIYNRGKRTAALGPSNFPKLLNPPLHTRSEMCMHYCSGSFSTSSYIL